MAEFPNRFDVLESRLRIAGREVTGPHGELFLQAADALRETNDLRRLGASIHKAASAAVDEERAAVVAWLTDEAPFMECQGGFAEEYAAAIQRGEHRKETK